MKRLRLALVAVAIAGAVTLAGCGSDDANDAAATTPAPTTAAAPAGDLVAVASAAPQLSTLVSAVSAAGLVSTLQGTGPFTVFAPTNDAFAALPAGVVDKLLLPCNKDALTKVLTYHVISGNFPSSAITAGQATTVEGEPVTIAVSNGVTVNNAKVVTADVTATNGVAHVIDAVLVPPSLDVSMLKASC